MKINKLIELNQLIAQFGGKSTGLFNRSLITFYLVISCTRNVLIF